MWHSKASLRAKRSNLTDNLGRLPRPLRGLAMTAVHKMKAGLRGLKLHTVCEEARCPNLSECFNRGTATFMILGNICTRSCRFCAVKHQPHPRDVDTSEPENVAKMVSTLGLKHIVLTSVTRDDLKDEGAGQFVRCIERIRSLGTHTVCVPRNGDTHRMCPQIEILTPDFHGRDDLLCDICKAQPDIFNHNIETVRRLTPVIRSNADYDRSLNVLKWIAKNGSGIVVKSGLMVGLGETREEIIQALVDLKNAGCQIVTIGQYLQPRKTNIEVERYLSEEEFCELKLEGERLGIKHVFSGPFVRSSYMTEETWRLSF